MPAQYVGLRNDPDGLTQFDAIRTSRDGGQVVTDLHGKYYEQASRGKLYTGSSASAGIALIVPATTGGHPTLWNPSDSGVNVSVVNLELGWVSGNNAPGAIEWAYVLNAGSTHATGAPVATATLVAPVGVLGGALINKAKWSPTTNTFTAAPVFLRSAGISLFTGIGTTAVAPFSLFAHYDGDFVLGPGTAVCLCTQMATTTAVFQVSISWEEIAI
jgi:hypothetical protein